MSTRSPTTPALRTTLAVTGFLLIAGFFLLAEHRAHLFGILPFLLLLACPLLHLLGHGGHGGHGAAAPEEREREGPRRSAVHAGHHASKEAP